jgi:hypothetical protein
MELLTMGLLLLARSFRPIKLFLKLFLLKLFR